jgi:hypothetical protein
MHHHAVPPVVGDATDLTVDAGRREGGGEAERARGREEE